MIDILHKVAQFLIGLLVVIFLTICIASIIGIMYAAYHEFGDRTVCDGPILYFIETPSCAGKSVVCRGKLDNGYILEINDLVIKGDRVCFGKKNIWLMDGIKL